MRKPINQFVAQERLGSFLKERVDFIPGRRLNDRDIDDFISGQYDHVYTAWEHSFGVSANLQLDTKWVNRNQDLTVRYRAQVSWGAVGAQSVAHAVAQLALYNQVVALASIIQVHIDDLPEVIFETPVVDEYIGNV